MGAHRQGREECEVHEKVHCVRLQEEGGVCWGGGLRLCLNGLECFGQSFGITPA